MALAPQDIKNVPLAHPEVAWALPLYVVASAKGEQGVTRYGVPHRGNIAPIFVTSSCKQPSPAR